MKRCVLLAIFVILSLLPAFAGARVVIDEVGREVTMPDRPARIVSLAPNITATLFALGCNDHIVGVTVHCNYPEAALSKERIAWMQSALKITLRGVLAVSVMSFFLRVLGFREAKRRS